MTDRVHASAAPAPVGAYPHARRVGNLLFLSGIGSRCPGSDAIPGNVIGADGKLLGHDIEAQCHQVFANVRTVLKAAHARWEDLIDITVYLTDMEHDFDTFNRVYAEYFPSAQPCRTTVGVGALPTAIAIELKCIAVISGEA